MRKATAAAFVLVSCLTGRAIGAECGLSDPHAPPHSGDLSWIDSKAVFYGAETGAGAFWIAPGRPGGAHAIGNHADDNLEDSQLSRSGRFFTFVSVAKNGVRTFWLYDVATKQETILPLAPPRGWGFYFSPNDDYLYWPQFDTGTITVVDLKKHIGRVVPLPDVTARSTAILDGVWSSKGDLLLYTAHKNDSAGGRYYAFDPALGTARRIDAVREQTAPGQPVTISYRENGIEIGRDDSAVHMAGAAPRNPDVVPLEGGAAVMIDNQHIFIGRPGKPDETIAAFPLPGSETASPGQSGCFYHVLAFAGVLDHRYVLYNQDDRIWIYGLREDRKAILVDSNVFLRR